MYNHHFILKNIVGAKNMTYTILIEENACAKII